MASGRPEQAPHGPAYLFLLDGWDQLSTWGWDEAEGSYWARLTRNGHQGGDPEVWITPPVWPVLNHPRLLLEVIANVVGESTDTVHNAMNCSFSPAPPHSDVPDESGRS